MLIAFINEVCLIGTCFYDDQRCNLSIARNLRDDSVLGAVLRKHLTLDTVRHKDRIDDMGSRELSRPVVMETLRSVKNVIHPFIPEKWRVPLDNKEGVIKQPIAACAGNVSHLDAHKKCILSKNASQIYKGFDNPTNLHFVDGVLFVTGEQVIYYMDHKQHISSTCIVW